MMVGASVAGAGAAMANERVGFLGLGTMGAAMAANLARAGFAVTAWNRTERPQPELDPLGVVRGSDPRTVAAATDAVVICVSDTPDVESILLVPTGARTGSRRAR